MPARAAFACRLPIMLMLATSPLAQALPPDPAAGRDLPSRGMAMSTVRARYGAPERQLAPRGGHGAHQPVIHRWAYPGYIVYFERSRVIDSVATAYGDGFSAPSD